MIAIVNYNAGNIRSVQNALSRFGASCILTDDPERLMAAEKVIFPGVGEASSAMKYLKARQLDKVICSLRQPVLGVCLGLQLLCQSSEENNTDCLGVFDVSVRRFPDTGIVPHMGWNNLIESSDELFSNFGTDSDVYFVHSYYAPVCPDTIAVCDYILPFSAALRKNNFYAVQFHPEKSGTLGAKILEKFLSL
jgi:glutamine amidotransferase